MNEKRREYLKNYRLKNKDRIKAYNKAYWSNLKAAGEYYKYRQGAQYGTLRGNCALGREYELLALSILPGSKDCNTDNFHGKWDITWNGVKIDVKMRNRRGSGWTFYASSTGYVDYYLLFCVEDGEVARTYLIPSKVFGKSVYIGSRQAKYDKYIFSISKD